MPSSHFEQSGGRALRGNPLFFVASGAAVVAVVSLAFGFAAKAIVESHRKAAFESEVRARGMVLDQLARSALFPLLGEDAATLGHLVRTPPGGEGFLYALVADGDNVIRAHTDPARVGDRLRLPLPLEASALLISRPLVFRNKVVGSAYLALPRDVIERDANRSVEPLRRTLTGLCGLAAAGIVLFGGVAAFRDRLRRRSAAGTPSGSEGERDAYRVHSIENGLPDSACASNREASGAGSAGLGESGHTPRPLRINRNPATVLVTNVRGFRGYSDSRRPEEVLEGLNGYFDIAEQAVAAHGGCVERFSGDTVVAVFGGTSILPDHTNRAVHAALAIQKALREAAEGGNGLFGQVAIGISSGVLLSCEGGAGLRTGSLMIGESFKSAEALATMAGPGEIVIGREVYQYLGSAVSADPIPPREKRDRTESWEHFRIQDDVRRGA